jgi:hypothetical protein
VHYTGGLLGLASLGGASLIAEEARAGNLGRMLLEAAGALFAIYVVFMAVLSVIGIFARRKAGEPPAHAVVHVGTPQARHELRRVR